MREFQQGLYHLQPSALGRCKPSTSPPREVCESFGSVGCILRGMRTIAARLCRNAVLVANGRIVPNLSCAAQERRVKNSSHMRRWWEILGSWSGHVSLASIHLRSRSRIVWLRLGLCHVRSVLAIHIVILQCSGRQITKE